MSLGVGIPSFGRFDDYTNEDEYPHITIIDVEDVRYAYYIPTAEEMVHWLSDVKNIHIGIIELNSGVCQGYINEKYLFNGLTHVATIHALIDSALDMLLCKENIE